MPRPEYPRPQFRRADWLNLNGLWQFEIDAGDSGLERGLLKRDLRGRITVPFCPEAPLSGVNCRDFMPAVWYRRRVRVPRAWAGRRVALHFQAVDYEATVWVNGTEVGRHRGGFTPFSCDITAVAPAGKDAVIVVRARDDHRGPQPRGKQSQRYDNYGCLYTRTTGIWQTVWLEPLGVVPPRPVGEGRVRDTVVAAACAFGRPRITPDVSGSSFRIAAPLTGQAAGMTVRGVLSDGKEKISEARASVEDFSPLLILPVPKKSRRLWAPGAPHLYGLTLELLDERCRVVDRVASYAGLRSVTIDGPAILINGRPIFQRLVLDQGYYPEGIMTAPSDAALRRDIGLSLAAGFNGARLHQKVFEERFLYHADRLGYLVWGEFPDWGCRGYGPEDDRIQPGATYITQWLEALERDCSHPCIIGWCPLNETSQPLTDRPRVLDDVTRGLFLAAKAYDLTRPVLDASGYAHRVPEADVYDCHDYEQDVEKFRANHAGLALGKPFINPRDGKQTWSIPWRGQPFFVSEFGGIWWNPRARPGDASWGYGARPKSVEEFHQRFAGLCAVLLDNPRMFGYCYTQLTDVYQEQNGIFTFARGKKFDLARLRRAQQRQAAIERGA